MKRNIITINKKLCQGCGQCVNTCHQGALKLIDGKATLISESYCDGLGLCLPECPSGALKVMKQEVQESFKKESKCSSIKSQTLKSAETIKKIEEDEQRAKSQLSNWPVQIKLMPSKAPYFKNAKLLIAADCTAFASANIHKKYMKDKITIIGCPKLDNGDYIEKFTELLINNNIQSITILRMIVPCCGGLEYAIKQGLKKSEKTIPLQIIVLDPSGKEV